MKTCFGCGYSFDQCWCDPDEILYSEEDYLEKMKQEREAAIEAEKAMADPEKDELEKEKTAAEIAEIEKDGRRKDEELQLKKAEFMAKQQEEANGQEQ